METDLQAKMKKLQSMKAGSDRTKLENDVMAQPRLFAQKAQAFEQDRARRSNEERGQTGYSYPDCCEIRCQQPGYRSGC